MKTLIHAKYYIEQKRYWYDSEPTTQRMRDWNGFTAYFDSKEEAEKLIQELDDEVYCQSHGEYSRPEYTVKAMTN